MKKKILSVIGTRPEIIKLSPLLPLLDKKFKHAIVHTGQHYDAALDANFFRELKIRAPDYRVPYFPKHSTRFAQILATLTKKIENTAPDLVLVQGDTHSALAGALAAVHLGIPIAHVEAGCRSGDLQAPEEVNRRMIDSVATYFFTPDLVAQSNLKREGKNGILVGNTGLDAAKRALPLTSLAALKRLKLKHRNYILLTLHRAENTNNTETLRELVTAINQISHEITIVWPMHPRTRLALHAAKIKLPKAITVIEPLGYIDTLSLMQNSLCIMSDSGGIQEEAAVVNRPCFILRDTTEWTRLVREGKNFLASTEAKKIVRLVSAYIKNPTMQKKIAQKKASLNYGASKKILRRLLTI